MSEEEAPQLALVKGEKPVFTILRASAGSGKTFNLVRFYLGLCLKEKREDYFRHILAITFTNKAANEMKERVINGMREVANGTGDHIEELVVTLGLAKEELQRRASVAYQRMLTSYGQLAIMTIDKFVNRLVRQFSRDLALNSEFQVQLDQDELVREAVDLLLSKVGSDEPELTKVMERYALQRIDDEKSWDMRSDLLTFGKLLFDEQVAPLLSKLSDYQPQDFIDLYDRLRDEIEAMKKEAVLAAQRLLDLYHQNGLSEADFSRGTAYTSIRNIAKGVFKPLSDTAIAMFALQKPFYAQKLAPERKAILDGIQAQIAAGFEPIDRVLGSQKGRGFRTKEMLTTSLFQLAVLQQLEQSVKSVSEARNSMTFADLNRLIELLVNDNPAPFIYERYGERYKHYLIDEFQDTSIVQWQNFLPLVEESLANSRFNLIVGDGKQAIYRWRNGDVRQLQALPKIIGRNMNPVMQAREDSLTRAAVKSNLGDNWRSLQAVVDFNNELFESLRESMPEHLSAIYQGLRQVPRGGSGGWVSAEVYFEKDGKQMHLKRLQSIADIIEANRKHSGVRDSEIAILVRNNKVGSAIARNLLGMNIQTVTSESLQLGLHPAPCAVVHLMQWLADRRNMVAVTKFLQCMAACRQDAKAAALSDQSFLKLLRHEQRGESHRRYFLDLEEHLAENYGIDSAQSLPGMPLFDLVNELLAKLGLGQTFPAYAEALLQVAQDYQTKENDGLPGFLDYWDSKGHKRSINVPEDMEGVRIMTVHKSKGLEFPVVICLLAATKEKGDELYAVELEEARHGLPMAVVGLSKAKDTEVHDQYEAEKQRRYLDELNVAYVGLTRAVAHLHVLVEASSSGDKEWRGEKMIAHVLKKMGLVEDDKGERGAPLSKEAWEKLREKKSTKSLGETRVIDQLVSLPTMERLKVGLDRRMVNYDGSLSAQNMGDELHAMLAKVKDRNDFERLKNQRYPWQRMNRSEWERLLQYAEEIVNHPEARAWFEPGLPVWNERELMTSEGQVVRPDRMLEIDGCLLVVDYKTGKQDRKKHQKQVNAYRAILENIQSLPVRTCLFYTDDMELVTDQ